MHFTRAQSFDTLTVIHSHNGNLTNTVEHYKYSGVGYDNRSHIEHPLKNKENLI